MSGGPDTAMDTKGRGLEQYSTDTRQDGVLSAVSHPTMAQGKLPSAVCSLCCRCASSLALVRSSAPPGPASIRTSGRASERRSKELWPGDSGTAPRQPSQPAGQPASPDEPVSDKAAAHRARTRSPRCSRAPTLFLPRFPPRWTVRRIRWRFARSSRVWRGWGAHVQRPWTVWERPRRVACSDCSSHQQSFCGRHEGATEVTRFVH